jgi:hypothetical protein
MTAKMAGVSTNHLFGETKFVPRSSAERWIADAREDALTDDSEAYERGEKAGFDRCLEMGAMLRRLAEDPTPSKYEHLVGLANVRRSYAAPDSGEAATDPAAVAKQILAAGAKARGASGPLPPPGSLARKILDAGAKRRGETPDDEIEQDDQGSPPGDDDDDEQPVRKRKKGRSKQHPDSDEIPHELTPPERKEPDPALDEMRKREREEGRRLRMRTADELEALGKPEPKVIDLADAIIAAGRKARGLPPLKE